MKEMAPIDYRVGFSDWLDSFAQDEQTCTERGCRNTIDKDIIYDAGKDDDAVCGVCAGTYFECDQCREIKPNAVQSDTTDLCLACFKENEAERESEDVEDDKPVDEDKAQFKADAVTIDRTTKEQG